MAENKDRLALRMKPATRQKIDQWCAASGCHSMNQFVEQANGRLPFDQKINPEDEVVQDEWLD